MDSNSDPYLVTHGESGPSTSLRYGCTKGAPEEPVSALLERVEEEVVVVVVVGWVVGLKENAAEIEGNAGEVATAAATTGKVSWLIRPPAARMVGAGGERGGALLGWAREAAEEDEDEKGEAAAWKGIEEEG